MNNPKPKPSPGAEDTQQFSADDVKQAGLKQYRSPRGQQQQTPPQPQNVAVQITAMLVVLALLVAILIAGVIITLNIIH